MSNPKYPNITAADWNAALDACIAAEREAELIAFCEPFPQVGAEPGDPDYLSDEEVEEALRQIRARLGLD